MSVLTGDTRFEDIQNNDMEVKSMCEVLDKVENRGIQQGIQQGIVALVESLREVGQTNDVIINKLMEKFGLSEAEAEIYL